MSNKNYVIASPVEAKQSGSSEIASSLPEEGTVKGILISPDAADVRAPSSPLGTPRNDRLTHLDPNGAARMVNVTGKIPTQRIALAGCEILMKPETLELLKSGQIKKGDAFTVSKIAGIMAAKKTHEMIPLCHPLRLEADRYSFSGRSKPRFCFY